MAYNYIDDLTGDVVIMYRDSPTEHGIRYVAPSDLKRNASQKSANQRAAHLQQEADVVAVR